MTAKLRIINVTDVYKLDNFPHLRTLIDAKRAEFAAEGGRTISILTGDFLAPYLLSSIDKGRGMTAMLNEVPIDYVIFGNHEDDLEHKEVCQRVADFKGIWINTNMRNYEAFHLQKDFEIIEVASKDGTNKKKIGLIGILSNSPGLYRKNPFGGATIDDPYETIALYKERLENEHKVDLVIPLCHLYVPQDTVTCERFDFPVILSGHDHHVVNEVINNTRLLKAGADAENAIILDLTWSSPDAPLQIDVKIEKVTNYKPNEALLLKVKSAYSVLDHLMKTQLTTIPSKFRPLSSVGSRSRPCTVASFLWSSLRDAFNLEDFSKEDRSIDCVHSDGSIRLEAETIVDESKCKYIDQTIQLPENSDIVNLYGRFRGQVLTITVPKKVKADDHSSQEDDHKGEDEAEGEDENERDDIKENRTKPEPENKKSDSDQDCRSLPKEDIKKPPEGKESVLAIVMKCLERNKVIVVSNAISFSMGMWVSKLWT